MAKANVRVRKKVKKNVAEGIAHVHAPSITPLLRLPTDKVMPCLGQLPAAPVLRAHVKVLHLLPR